MLVCDPQSLARTGVVRPLLPLRSLRLRSASSSASSLAETPRLHRPVVLPGAPTDFKISRVWDANQRLYNRRYPTTPVPAVYRGFTWASNSLLLLSYGAMAAFMTAAATTGIWVPMLIVKQRADAEKRFAPLKGEIN